MVLVYVRVCVKFVNELCFLCVYACSECCANDLLVHILISVVSTSSPMFHCFACCLFARFVLFSGFDSTCTAIYSVACIVVDILLYVVFVVFACAAPPLL